MEVNLFFTEIYYYAGVVEDVLVVPVNISYDKITERHFVKDELMVKAQ